MIFNFDSYVLKKKKKKNLTPCDFAMWGIIKEKVFQTKPNNIGHLKELITDAFEELDKDNRTILAICNAAVSRCVETNGQHFEHLS